MMLLTKVAVLASALAALVLVSAHLALAQQDTQPSQIEATHQEINNTGTQTTGGEQTAAPDPAAQESGGSTPPSPSGSADQSSPGNNPNSLMRLDNNNKLIVDCEAVDNALTQQGQGTPTSSSDPQSQAALTGLKELSQLCTDSGFTPGGGAPSGSNPSGASSTQPQQGESTSSPTDTSSMQPQQNGGTS